MKKILSIMMVLCITLSLMSSVVPVFAADEAGVMTVAELNTLEAVRAAVENDPTGQFSVSVGETYNGAPVSLKWTFKEGRNATPTFALKNTDVSAYTHFRMRFYSANAGESFYIFAGSAIEGGVDNPYFYRPVTTTGNGWQEISVPLSYFTKAAKQETEPSWENVSGICFYTRFLDIDTFPHTPGANIYIDKIWFENSNKTYTSGEDTKDGDIPVFDVTSVADQDASSGDVLDYIETVNAREGGNGAYLMREIPALSKKTTYYDPTGTLNVTDKGYLNMWVYSPKASNGALIVRLHDSAGAIKGYFRENKANQERMLLDWEGWNLISIDLSDTWNGGSSGGYDSTKFDKVEITTNWNDSDQAGGATAQWHTASHYGIDKIWFSATQPTVTTTTEDAAAWTLPDGHDMIQEFNTATAVQNSSNSGNNGHALVNTLNTNLYNVSYRNTFARTNEKAFSTLICAFNNLQATQAKTVGKDYLHFWMYNPGIKYNGDDITDVCLLIEEKYGTTTQHETITLDWEGWKLVTVALNDTVKEKGFGTIRLAGNYTTTNIGCTYSGCAATPLLDVYLSRYYDFDNFWVSNSTISSPVMTSAASDGAAYTFAFNNDLESAAAEKISVYKNYTAANDATVAVDGNVVTVTLANAPTANDKYQIRFDKDMRDAYGAKIGDESFVFEDISSDTLTVDNVNGTISGFKGMTMAQVKAALDLTEGMTLTSAAADETVAESGMKITAAIGADVYSKEYTLDIPLYEVTGVKYYVDNAEVQNNFAAGTFKAEISAVCYNKKSDAPALMIVSQIDSDSEEVIKVEADEVAIKNSGDAVSVTLDIDSVANSKVQVFLWDSPNLQPMASYELTPAAQ